MHDAAYIFFLIGAPLKIKPSQNYCIDSKSDMMPARTVDVGQECQSAIQKLTEKHRLFYVCVDSIATSVGLTEPISWITLALLDKSWPTDIIFCKESKHCAS